MESGPTYVTTAHIRQHCDVSTSTLLRWANAGKVRVSRVAGIGRRLYHAGDVAAMLGLPDEPTPEPAALRRRRTTILYARVSSAHQTNDLARQVADLRRLYGERVRRAADTGTDGQPADENIEVVTDVASGLNWNRPGLLAVLERVHEGAVDRIVVSHRDRLARFGTELIEWILRKATTELVVLDQPDDAGAPNATECVSANELHDDLLAVTTFFVARHNGLRSAAKRKSRRDAVAVVGGGSDADADGGDDVAPGVVAIAGPDGGANNGDGDQPVVKKRGGRPKGSKTINRSPPKPCY